MSSNAATPPRAGLAPAGAVVLFLLLVALTAAAYAQPPQFSPGGDLDLVIGGTIDPAARIYESQADAALLVVSDRLPTPVLLHVRSRGVQAVPAARLRQVGGGVSLERGAPLADLGAFQLDGTEVHFSHGAMAAALRPKPALVGEHSIDELYEHTPKYRSDAALYVPDPTLLDKLRQLGGGYRVKVVFGSWCSVCKHYLPRGLAVASALDGAGPRFEYLGLPLEDPWASPEVARLGVKSLPTAIVYRGDREIGRFAGGEGWEQPEARLWDAISAAKP
jgi:thiol-disulfide isomerase/thioredoxin